MGKMCEILSYDKIFRLSSAQCFNVYIHVSNLSLVEAVPHCRNSIANIIAKVVPHKIDYIL